MFFNYLKLSSNCSVRFSNITYGKEFADGEMGSMFFINRSLKKTLLGYALTTDISIS